MSATDRRVREVFIELSDTLVDDFDIIEFLDRLAARCSELLGVSACGILLLMIVVCGSKCRLWQGGRANRMWWRWA